MKLLKYITCLILLPSFLFAWESYDRVIATVNTRPILESAVEERLYHIRRTRRLTPAQVATERQKIVDRYIEDILVSERSEELVLVLNDRRINEHLMQIMMEFFLREDRNQNNADAKTRAAFNELNTLNTRIGFIALSNIRDVGLRRFVEYVERTENTTFQNFLDDIRSSMMRAQLIQVTMGVSPPTQQEARNWYNANRTRLGFEVNVRHILIVPKGSGFRPERDASRTLEDLRRRIVAGESFEKLASQYSEDPGSRGRGGNLGWVMIGGLDPHFAGAVYQMRRRGEISQPVKSSFGYHLIQYNGRRDIPFEKVENFIMRLLSDERMAEQFNKWLAQRRSESEIIFYNN